jgi:hypothetical protein
MDALEATITAFTATAVVARRCGTCVDGPSGVVYVTPGVNTDSDYDPSIDIVSSLLIRGTSGSCSAPQWTPTFKVVWGLCKSSECLLQLNRPYPQT